MLQIGFAGLDDLDEADFAGAVDTALAPLRAALAAFRVQPDVVLPCGNSRIVAFATPEAAWDFARSLLALPAGPWPLTVAGHYALAHWLETPPALVGRSVAELGLLASAALPGAMTVSEPFASALFLAGPAHIYAEPVGELGTLRLFAIRGGEEA